MSNAELTAATGARSGFAALLRQGVSAHGLFLIVALAYVLAFFVTGLFVPAVANSNATELLVGLVTFSVPAALLSLAIYLFAHMAMTDRPEKPIKVLFHRLKAVLTDRARMAAGLPLFAALLLFMFAFTGFKGNITAIVPFTWDETFSTWDKALHFGRYPHDILQPIFGWAPLTFLLNVNYNAWFFVMNLFWVHYVFIKEPGVERSRFFLAFMFIVVTTGTVLAIIFSSAGPCYYTLLGLGADPYTTHMAYLRDAHQWLPIWAIDTQDMLWRYRESGSVFGGISAMPSVHNATALLFALATRNKAPWLRNLMFAHAVLIFLGSIHLGWHYAVDAYMAWPVALLCWWVAMPLATWWESTRPMQNFKCVLQRELAA